MKNLLTNKLYKKRHIYTEAIHKINKQIQDIEKEERIKRLSGYIGKYYKESGYGEHYLSIYYVIGISKDTTRNRVLQVAENGDINPWYTFEEQDCVFKMEEKTPCTKTEFDRIIKIIQKKTQKYLTETNTSDTKRLKEK